MEHITPFILVVLTGLGGFNFWLFKRIIANGEAIVELKVAFRFYLERTGLDSARILAGSTNPTPPEMALLLRKYVRQEIENGEREVLVKWLTSVMDDADAAKGERSIALQLLASMDTLPQLKGHDMRGR